MTQQQLQQDLSNSLSDGETLCRVQISSAIDYLMRGQNFTTRDVRSLLEELLTETLESPSPARWVN